MRLDIIHMACLAAGASWAMTMVNRSAISQDNLPEWGLFVREPFAGRILAGSKDWEVRRRATRRRGRIGIICDKKLLGTVELYDVAGPFHVAELAAHVSRHRAPIRLLEQYSRGRPLYAWLLRNPVRFAQPITIRPGKGPVVWFHLARMLPKADKSRP